LRTTVASADIGLICRSFFSSASAFSLGFLGELGLGDALFQFGHLVAAFLAVAELLLDRLHLFIQVVFALGLLHLALDARADALLDLKDRDLTFHEAERLFEACLDAGGFQHLLLFGDLDRQMRSDRIGKLRIVVDLAGCADNFRRNLLVELHVALEFGDDRAAQRFKFDRIVVRLFEHMAEGFVEILAVRIGVDLGARAALDQNLDGSVRAASAAAVRWQRCRHCGWLRVPDRRRWH
jgi:hypothetical protein